MRNEEIIKDIVELIQMSFKGNIRSMNVKTIQEKVKQFNEWNNEVKFYEFALNLTEEEQKTICNKVYSWAGFFL